MTSKTFFDDHLNGLQECVKLASDEIMEIYCSENYGQEEKSDGSPLTLADKRSNEIISVSYTHLTLPTIYSV